MKRRFNFSFALLVSITTVSFVGCDSGPRQVQETSEYTFDDMAAQAAADSELSEVEE
ncbi:MAG: hypothetical protein WBD20_06645 [Pirellulaceae bacterium]